MLTWITLWPFIAIPFLFPFVLGILPTFQFVSKEIGGPLVRQFFVNQVSSLLPYDQGVILVNWFTHASITQEIILHAVICLNVGLLFYPIFYAIGTLAIRTTAWSVKTELAQRQSLLNRR